MNHKRALTSLRRSVPLPRSKSLINKCMSEKKKQFNFNWLRFFLWRIILLFISIVNSQVIRPFRWRRRCRLMRQHLVLLLGLFSLPGLKFNAANTIRNTPRLNTHTHTHKNNSNKIGNRMEQYTYIYLYITRDPSPSLVIPIEIFTMMRIKMKHKSLFIVEQQQTKYVHTRYANQNVVLRTRFRKFGAGFSIMYVHTPHWMLTSFMCVAFYHSLIDEIC